MELKLNKKKAEELMNLEGETRGVTLQTDADFVRRKRGEEGVRKVEKRMEELGVSLKYGEVEAMNFYPIGLRALSVLVIQDALGFSDAEIEEMGRQAPKRSWIIKLFAKFFFSIKKSVVQAPHMWEKHYTRGRLEAEADEENKVMIITLKGLDLHPLFCVYLKGYLSTIVGIIVDAEVESERTKCPFIDGRNTYHEYRFKW